MMIIGSIIRVDRVLHKRVMNTMNESIRQQFTNIGTIGQIIK